MSIQEQKITEAAIAANGVQSRPDKLTGTAAQNKKVFDALVTAVVREKFNALLDELTGTTAAAQLGITTIPGFSAGNGSSIDSLRNSRITQKEVPSFSRLATVIVPPIASTTALVMDIPRPVPWIWAAIACSLRENGSKIRSIKVGDMPIPLSATVNRSTA